MTQGFWKFFSQSLRVHSLYHTHSLAKFNGKCSSWLKNVYSERVHLEKLSRGYKSWVEGVGGITSLVSTLHIVFDNSNGGANTPFAPPSLPSPPARTEAPTRTEVSMLQRGLASADFLQPAKTATVCIVPCAYTCPPSLSHLFCLCKTCLYLYAPTDNMQPKSDDKYTYHQWLCTTVNSTYISPTPDEPLHLGDFLTSQ